MKFARAVLIVSAAVFAGFGLLLLVVPETLNGVGVELTSPTAFAEIRGFYGGLELGVAMFLALSASRPTWMQPALFAQAAILGGVALGRLAGVFVDGATDGFTLGLMSMEAAGSALAIVAYRKLHL
jgi:peptidoglycan/LPS O-acetylase OafA/YrhL